MMVFVDSSALYAIANREEEPHSRAAEAWRRLLADQAVLLTTNYVLLETSALVQRRLGMEALRDFETSVVPLLHVEWVDEERHRFGAQAVLSANRKKLSLVDCVSFQVMRETGIRTAFCFDEHFREQGFDVIP